MEWSIDSSEQGRFISVNLHGPWDLETGVQALRSVWEEQARSGIHRVLWDLSGVVVGGVSSAEMREISTRQLQDRPDLPDARAAAVAPSDLGFGMARMIEAFVTETPVDFQVFRTLEEASLWLEEED